MDIGDRIVIQGNFRNRAGQPADPNAVTGAVKQINDAHPTTLIFVRKSTGVWESEYDVIKAGQHKWRIEGTGLVKAAAEGTFTVNEQAVVIGS